MDVAVVVYDSLDELSGGYRYNRKLVEYLRTQGDSVEVITVPHETGQRMSNGHSSTSLRRRLNQPVDVLLEDELCRPSLLSHNSYLDEPGSIVSLVHLLDSAVLKTESAPSVRKDKQRYSNGRTEKRRYSEAVVNEQRYLETVDGVLCTSQDTHRRVESLADVPSTVAYPAGRVEGTACSRQAVDARARDGPLNITFLGSVTERKGLLTLLDALGSLSEGWTATVVGRLDCEPAYVERVRAEITQSELEDRLTIRGVVSGDTLDQLLRESHVLAVPSRYESFGMAYLEAMEYGVVPVATSAGGPDEFIDDGTSGVLVDPGDVDTLTETLEMLAVDRAFLASLATGALDAAETHPTWRESMKHARQFLLDCTECGSSTSRKVGGDSP